MAAEIEGVAKSAGDQDQQSREGEDVVEAMGATAKEVAGRPASSSQPLRRQRSRGPYGQDD
jgi:hypothetical protein